MWQRTEQQRTLQPEITTYEGPKIGKSKERRPGWPRIYQEGNIGNTSI